MKRMHTEQEIKELAQEQITQSPTIVELQAKIAAIEANKANVFEFEGGIEDLDADALAALYESKAQIIKFVTEIETVFYRDVFTNLEMRFFNISQNKYTYFEAERATTDDSWYVGYTVEETLLVDGNINLNGNFTADSIIEKMSGYSFTPDTTQDSFITKNYIYASCVKNGNKITFVVFVTFTCLTDITSGTPLYFGEFEIPNSVYEKLIPYTQGTAQNTLETKNVRLMNVSSTASTPPNGSAFLLKQPDNKISLTVYNSGGLVQGNSFNVRYETTMLLSDNMIPQNP